MRPVNRITPALPVGAMKTYEIRMPKQTHWREATCAEVECPEFQNGWTTRLPRGSELVDVLRRSGRRFHEITDLTSPELEFIFEPGQPCFRATTHRVRVDRPELFVVREGDWRGNPRGTSRQHRRPEDWVDDFATHQDKLATALERG